MRLTEAVDDGRLSSEEAIRGALGGTERAQALLGRARRRPCQRPTVHPKRTVPAAVARRAVEQVRRRYGRLSNIASVHWGMARHRGRPTADTAVVVAVSRKLSAAALRRNHRRPLPRQVVVTHARRRYTVRVDIQAAQGLARLQAPLAEPGDHGAIHVGSTFIGALGAFVEGGGGLFAITAGHVAELLQGAVADCIDDEAGRFRLGALRVSLFGHGLDIGAIGPVRSPPAQAVLPETLVRDPDVSDVHRRVHLHLPGLSTVVDSHIEAVDRVRGFDTPAGPITMDGLTAITRITQPGDSGSPALDDHGILVGFVLGSDDSHTFLLPAKRALDALHDDL
jgi:hypothetical protein